MDIGKKGLMLVFATAIISGFSIFVNSIGVKEFDSSIFTFLKNTLVALFLLSIMLAAGNYSELKLLKRKQWLQLLLIGLIGGSIPFLLYFQGLKMATGATAGFIHKTMFLYIAVFALVFLKEKLTKGLFVGASFLLIGNYLLMKPDFAFSAGHLMILAATLFWAIENTYSKHILREMSGNVVAFGRMFFGSVFMLVFLIWTGKIGAIGNLTPVHLMWISLTSIFLLLYVLTYYNGLKYVKVTTAACMLALGQPITMILGFAFKGKAFALEQAIGMLLIAAGVISAMWLPQILSRLRNASGIRYHGRD